MTAKELYEKMFTFSSSYFLPDLRKDKNDFYALTPEELNQYWVCIGGYVLNLYMDGELDKANEYINSLPEDSLIRLGLTVVNPTVSWKKFVKTIKYLKKINQPLQMVMLTAGRPYLLNGFNDFTRLGPFLVKYKDLLIEDINFLYGTECSSYIYNLSLAEYYYQMNKLIDAEIIVSRTIKEFDKKNEFRFLFTALFLESRILLANGKIIRSSDYIQQIKLRVKELGKAEFSYNIDAVEVLFSFYQGNFEIISNWMKTDAPDELCDFNMLDLFRYMVKIRCYIVQKEYSSAIALIEKLRPLLEESQRHMDLCEINLLFAIACFAAGKKEQAFEGLEEALRLARRRKYYRLVADEGGQIFNILREYIKEKEETPFIKEIIEMTRRMAIQYPLYLVPRYINNEKFTQIEIDLLNLLQQGKSYEEIGEYFFISVNTVKYHIKKIYSKLDTVNSNQAVWKAKLLGLIK